MAVSIRHRWLNRLLAGTLCVVAACVVQQAAVLTSADWTSSMARHALSKWATGSVSYTPEQWESAREALQDAVEHTPRDATLHDALAQLYSVQGRQLWTTGAANSPEVQAYLTAMAHQQTSLRLRPTHAMAWANLALIQYAVNDTPEALLRSWNEAARLGPRESEVIETLAYVAAEVWPLVTEEMRQWIELHKPGLVASLDKRPSQ
jgi:tetratricopeptide (TPR) repeat protein